MFLADGNMIEYHEIKRSTVSDYVRKFEQLCKKIAANNPNAKK